MSVYALGAFKKNNSGEFKPDGFLLFPNEERADKFLSMGELQNHRNNGYHYEKNGFVEINQYVTGRVMEQKHFFVRNIEMHQD